MSNARLLWSLTFVLFPQVILAGPHFTVSLSPHLTNVIPACARRCVETYILEDFHSAACREQQDLQCLCKSKSSSGFTLGERALQCTAAYCTTEVLENEVDVYEICADVKNARSMTHGTLSATQVPSATAAQQSHTRTKSPHSLGLSVHKPATIASSSMNVSASLPTVFSTTKDSGPSKSFTQQTIIHTTPTNRPSRAPHSKSTSAPTSASTSVIASPATSSAASKPQPVLTKPQIAGVTVAGVASAAIAFGVIFCLFCIRGRDRRRRNSGSSFGGDKILPSRPSSPEPSAPAASDPEQANQIPAGSAVQALNGAVPRSHVSRFSFWRRSTRPEEIGIAVGPEVVETPSMRYDAQHDETPVSAASYRTTSQLLPDKPSYVLFPPPLRVVNPTQSPVSPQSPDSAETHFTDIAGQRPESKPAPRGRNAYDTSQVTLQRGAGTLRPSGSDPFLDRQNSSRGLARSENHQDISAIPQIRSLQPVGRAVSTQSRLQSSQPTTVRTKPSIRVPTSYAGRPTYRVSEEHNAVPDQSWGSTSKRRNSFARPQTRDSNASDTSFEDADEQDEPPTVHPTLSPVVESPQVRSLPGAIRYPKVPGKVAPYNTRRPSPESPTRRPPPKNPQRAIIAQAGTRKIVPVQQPEVAELYGSPVSPKTYWSDQPRSNETLRSDNSPTARSAKWQILVKPGLEAISDDSSLREKPTPSPRSGKTGESRVSDQSGRWTPVSNPNETRR